MNNTDNSDNLLSYRNIDLSNNIFDIILSEMAYRTQYQQALNNSLDDTNMYEKVISKIGLKQLKKKDVSKNIFIKTN